MEEKDSYRRFMRNHRRQYVASDPVRAQRASSAITQRALEMIQTLCPDPLCHSLAGYWAFGQEVDPLPLMRLLSHRGYSLSLPKANESDTTLSFCAWEDGMEMVQSDLGFYYPLKATRFLMPSLILIPLLAFDRRGYRLGYGKGHYDRTLELLYQKNPKLKTLGLAYAMQQVDHLPAEPHDVKLDMVVTEDATVMF